ncbi:MAG: DUF2974 domain-containing protein [Clostridia bacterium]|nr:DUF2974 domain-containing protein [Clostridia bacterium]
MANLLDYLDWRGDLSFGASALADVDLLTLSRAAYLPFDGVVTEDTRTRTLSLGQAAERVLALFRSGDAGHALRLREDERLLELLTESPRFAQLTVFGYVNRFDQQRQEQFSAVSFLLPDETCAVAFRGTDGTLVGWKEDFNMAFADAVAAQLDAKNYVDALAFSGPLRLCGHSKGGNLAVYAGAFSMARERVIQVRSFDGPGFNERVAASPEIAKVAPRVRTLVPQSSVIGMLMEHSEDFSIVRSKSVGVFQHDVYNWQVTRNEFLSVKERTNSSVFIDAAFKRWVADMRPELREKMINGVFAVLDSTDGRMPRDLFSPRSAFAMVKAAGEMDEETRSAVLEAFKMLRGAMTESLPALLEQGERERR